MSCYVGVRGSISKWVLVGVTSVISGSLSGCLAKDQKFSSGSTTQAQSAQAATSNTSVLKATSSNSQSSTPYSLLRPTPSALPNVILGNSSGPTGGGSSLAVTAANDFEYFDPPLSQIGGASYMPFYNQNDPALASVYLPGTMTSLLPNGYQYSNLCGPTAAAMLIEGIATRIAQLYMKAPTTNSWTDRCFYNPRGSCYNSSGQIDTVLNPHAGASSLRIANTSVKIGPTNLVYYGTTLDYAESAISQVAGDFGGLSTAPSGSAFLVPTTQSTFISAMNSSATKAYAVMVDYGHYQASVTTSAGVSYVTYNRYGGHFIVFSGYYTDSSNNQWINVHDPWTLDNNFNAMPQILKHYQVLPFVSYSGESSGDVNDNVGGQEVSTAIGLGYLATISADQPTQNYDIYQIIEGYQRMSAPR